MKLTALMLFLALMQVNANTLAQKVTLSERNSSLTNIFIQIRHQTGYDFAYTTTTIQTARPVTIDVKNMELNDVLKMIFNDQPLDYKIEDKSVAVSRKKEPSLFDNLKDKATKLLGVQTAIHGKIIDSIGEPLIGAVVTLKDTKYSAISDNKGNFNIPSVAQGNYTLVITYIGYDKLERKLETEGKDLNLVLRLHASVSSLDQVRIIAYGSDTKRFSVGAVASISAEQIEKQPVINPLLAMEGLAPGLNVTAQNGAPGSTVLVQVRGQNTLSNNTFANKPYDQPLFIIDGVPFAAGNTNINQLSNLANAASISGGLGQATGVSPFSNINPNDIESITILKDADATSIYGSQGANGVVLITTKKGKPGKTTINVSLNTQYNSVAKPVQLLNTQQYLQLRKNAYAVDNITPTSNPGDYLSYAPDLTIFDQNKYTNWQKIIQGNSTYNTDMHASISGGNANNTFIVSTGYTRSGYNYPGDFSDQRYTLHSAFHNNSADKRFTLDLITDYGYDQNNSASYGGSQDVALPPNLPNLLDPSGNLVWNYKGVPLNSNNFYSSLLQPSNVANYNFNTALNLNYKIFDGLSIAANLGYNHNTGTEHSINPATAQDPASDIVRAAAFANTSAQIINIEPQINYNKSIGKGVLTALLGATYKKNITDAFQDQAYGYSNDNFLNSVNGASTQYPFDQANIIKYVAIRSRLKYVYDQKYIIQVSGTRDGSSNFGPGRQFGNFGSVGAGWIFSEEKAFKEALPFFSYGKLSGSYGTTGSDASKAYNYQALYSTAAGVAPFQNIPQGFPYNLYNPDFSWATKKSLNLAADFGFFNNRLLLNATYYRDREGDQLVDYPLAIQSGFPTVYENQNSTVQNKGWEFTATSTNIKTKDFTWTSNFNITFNRNKLLSFPNLAASSYSQQYVIGQPTSVIIGYKYKDVNPTTGLFEFYDKNGNVTSSPKYGTAAIGGDETVIGNRETNYMGGIGNTFNYKHFSLYVFCQFSSGDAPNYLSAFYNSSGFPGGQNNEPAYLLGKYWTAPGDQASLQRLVSSFQANGAAISAIGTFSQSSGAFSNDTYLRVKTAALSYALPDAWVKKINIRNASIYVSAQNLFTFTNYKIGDPEQPGNYTSFPLQRIIAFGLSFQL
ncbi:SusC/RagA family TonB-linked outer membrane protein [Pedobacter sp. L105]|uniref:SusC/RagA family TonB-linked outer membrane protein n=1 Tax=Pedobacter sp. L105 TaxID=1641871 RepID=UPI0020B10E77|nr:SusC/RagA family TonB-linked outer membrane protein [Pedobacter sp. L105]